MATTDVYHNSYDIDHLGVLYQNKRDIRDTLRKMEVLERELELIKEYLNINIKLLPERHAVVAKE